MANNKALFVECNKSLAENKLKLAFAAGVMLVSVMITFIVFGFSAIILSTESAISLLSIAMAAILLAGMYTTLCILFYGFFVLVTRLYKKEFVTVGFIFYGFKDFKRLVKLGLLFALLMLIVSMFFASPIIYFQLSNPDYFTAISEKYGYIFLSILSLGISLTVIVFVLPYTFAFFTLSETQPTHTDNALLPYLKKSKQDMHGKKLFLLFTCVSYAKKELFVLLTTFCIPLVMGLFLQESTPLTAFIASLANYLYYIYIYLILVKSITVTSALYYGAQRMSIEDTSR